MDCPDENDLGAFVERKLADADHASLASHLDACATCLAIICEMARSDGAAPDTIRDHRYRLLEMVGQGAMGSVYAAHDTTLDRKVALKVVRSDRLTVREARERLLREAQAMAQVSHPNVVTVHDAGEMDGGVFIAMEFIEGTTLRRWSEGRPWREVFEAYLDAGRGLAAAHRAGIVHRDFKPENVLVEWSGRVTVTDFGLARTATRAHIPGAELTSPGDVLGTPSYMAPEQRAGEVVDARADQFSFAVALHRALYRQDPFSSEPVADALGAPPILRRALHRALRARPADRFPDIQSLLDELERAVRRPRAPRTRARGSLGFILAALAIASGTVTLLATRERVDPPAPAATDVAAAASASSSPPPPPSLAPSPPEAVPAPPLPATATAIATARPSAATPRPAAPPSSSPPRAPTASRSSADDFPPIRK